MNTRTLQVVAEGARQQNLLAPVSRLPPELVLHIFSYVKAVVTLESKHVYRINEVNRRKWIMLTHIFHLWRDIALCTPSLWSNIHISEFDYKWANTMLQRSQHVPLNVHVRFRSTDEEVQAHQGGSIYIGGKRRSLQDSVPIQRPT